MWLLNEKGEILEPALWGFPNDEFGFLVEIRSLPLETPERLLENMIVLIKAHTKQAETLGFQLKLSHREVIGKELVETCFKKYSWTYLPDLTANLKPGITSTHATGVEGLEGTAGLHVHFSRHFVEGSTFLRVQLPIEKITRQMDSLFREEILQAKRILSEYEIKAHGFEYRSLPATVDLEKVIKASFNVLKAN